jgi:CheY-like chemotaxis protein/HPt (histidine-containing phosphotransfer) domain-containing protein
LGLAISKKLVEQMSGEIGVESTLGEGSLFWFTAYFRKQPSNRQQADCDRMNLQGLRLCCVDDNETNRYILVQYAREWGMDVSCAATSREALTLIKNTAASGKPFDLAILDMKMLGMDGLTLARTLKADPATSAMRLVLLTSLGRRGDAGKAQEAGFSGYLTKPLQKKMIESCLEIVMGFKADESQGKRLPLITKYGVKECGVRQVGRILVAEDQSVNQELAIMMLERMGHHVDVVANGEEAVEAVRHKKYDVVLMDCRMPEMDGYTATQAIRKREGKGKRIPIIAVTANAMQGDHEKCLKAGMDDYVTKPIKAEKLEAVLSRWLSKETSEQREHEPTGYVDPALVSSYGEMRALSSRTLEEWRAMFGEGYSDFLARIVEQFVKDVGECVEQVQKFVHDGELEPLANTAHGLKGISGNVGAERLHQLALNLEQNCRHGSGEKVHNLVSQIQEEFGRVEQAFHDELAQQTKSSI